ncbi:DNA polymerase III subunit delta [Thalassoglobus polymorphus]|uniref:DNA polymerase III subunit delta n=1 Tax=Thalassoglobus polymorphus TaxID=2527994 RepID=A0A517QVA5_9PLAN|nr:DNA polymerase III subunit delta [Thalassoglobus polymorphus]QDT35563.1 DNA polymerase III subunit delta [Thalassoglobus polymorphus]
MHATDFIKQKDDAKTASMIVLYGNESHLKTSTLDGLCQTFLGSPIEESIGLTRFTGKETDFRTVRDEIQTVSMFTPSKLVVVENADEFVSANRPQLESFAANPVGKSKLVLEVKKWPGNTKLAKKIAKTGLAIECSELTGGRLSSWLVMQAKEEYEKHLTRDAAQLIMELAGTGMGLLDQELQKLTSYVGDREKIGAEDVRTLVGGWKAETTWTMINAARDGQTDLALNCLQKLMHAGEAPQKILGGMNYVFKKIALATELSRQGKPLPAALKEAGVFYKEIDDVERYLRRIRRPRAERILNRLAQADSDLKGRSQLPLQMQMEQLILWLSGATEV